MLGLFARHLVGGVTAWLVFTAEGIVVYVGLLGYAVATGADIGGPLAGPFMVLLAAVAGVALLPLLFLPSVVAGELAAPGGRLSRKLLVALGTAAALVGVCLAVAVPVTDLSFRNAMLGWPLGLLAVVFPVTAYVGMVHGTHRVTTWLARRIRAGSVSSTATGSSTGSAGSANANANANANAEMVGRQARPRLASGADSSR